MKLTSEKCKTVYTEKDQNPLCIFLTTDECRCNSMLNSILAKVSKLNYFNPIIQGI